MQSLWQLLTRRKAAPEAEAEATPLCPGLAAPVHEIRGPLLAYNLPESSAEDEAEDARDPPVRVGSLQEGGGERVSGGSDVDPRAPPAPAPVGRASAATLWLRWRLSAVASALFDAWHALAWTSLLLCARLYTKLIRFIAWEQRHLERLAGPRPSRLRCIAQISLIWAIFMTFLSTMVLATWLTEEFVNERTGDYITLRSSMIIVLVPAFLLVHVLNGVSAWIMYRAYTDTPSTMRRRSGSRVRPSQRNDGPRRSRRLLRERTSDGRSTNTTRTMVNIPLPESTLNMAESEAEIEQNSRQESGDLQSRVQLQHQQSQPAQTSQLQSQRIIQPHLQIAAPDRDSGREADIESSESPLRQTPQALPISKDLLKRWLISATFTFAACAIGMMVCFITEDSYAGLFLLIVTFAGALPTLDIYTEYYEIDEELELAGRNDAEPTPSPTIDREMVNFAEGNRSNRRQRRIDERTPLLSNN